MVTTVGHELTLSSLVGNLLLLEHDMIAAYYAAIERLESPRYKQKLMKFKADHDRHVQELTELVIWATPHRVRARISSWRRN